MLDNNLAGLAKNYLTTPQLYRSQERQAIIAVGAAIVFPLLEAALTYFNQYQRTDMKELRKTMQKSETYRIFIEYVASSYVEDVKDVVSVIGQQAQDALCRALWEDSTGMRLFAAIVLSDCENLSFRTTRQVENALKFLDAEDRHKKYYKGSTVRVLLTLIAEPLGNPKIKRFIQTMTQEHNRDVKALRKLSQISIWYYLLNTGFME